MHHRHVSQLYGLYPGNLIHREDKELLAARRVALDRRGDEGNRLVHGMEGVSLGARLEMESVR